MTKALERKAYTTAKSYAPKAVQKLQALARGFVKRKSLAKNIQADEKNRIGRLAAFGKTAIARGFTKLARRF
jgi:hypothetical protein